MLLEAFVLFTESLAFPIIGPLLAWIFAAQPRLLIREIPQLNITEQVRHVFYI